MIRLLVGGALAVVLAHTASAQEIKSVYTTFDSQTCRHIKGKDVEDYGSWRCRGLNGIDVRLSAGDQRMYVTFGNAPKDEDLAATQSFPGFNNVYKGTVEWRGETLPDGKFKPFATILRWNVVTDSDHVNARGPVVATGRVLVVTRLGPGGICHVGYIDARSTPRANEVARKVADDTARGFRCGTDEPYWP